MGLLDSLTSGIESAIGQIGAQELQTLLPAALAKTNLGDLQGRVTGVGLRGQDTVTGTGYELPNFAARSRRQTFSAGAARPSRSHNKLSRSLPKLRGAGVAAVGIRVGACDAALAPRPIREIAATIAFR
jgi:hypothetical protein